MPRIIYTDHLSLRLKIRKIPEDYPGKIYQGSEQKFFDNIEKTNIAVKKLFYNKKKREMMIAYEERNNEVEIITIHPITEEKIINRVMSGRWTRK